MDNDYNSDDNTEYLPEESIMEYRVSPVAGEPMLHQMEYWRKRAKYFENNSYRQMEIIKEMQERGENDDSGDWWKK